LLKKIESKKLALIKEGKLKKQKQLTEITDDENLYQLPSNWDWCRLGNVLEIISDYHSNGSYEVLKANVELLDTKDYAIILRTTNFSEKNYYAYKYITESAYNFLSKSKLFPGDIIVNKIGDPGAAYYVDDRGQPMSLAMNLFQLRVLDMDSKFLYLYLKSHYDYVRSFAAGTSTQTITKDAINNLLFPLCSVSEQQRIVAKVDQFMTLCDQLKAGITSANQLQQKLADVMTQVADC
jgi:type I restriction enzyme S subunit